MSIAYIGLGSNLDNPVKQVKMARKALDDLSGCHMVADSGLFRSKSMTLPDDDEEQPDYINAVVKIETQYSPLQLLDKLQQIEHQQGRKRIKRWGARTLDMDILLYDDVQMSDEKLTIPHAGMAERDFVLYPLQAIDKNLVIPGLGALKSILENVPQDNLQYLGAFE